MRATRSPHSARPRIFRINNRIIMKKITGNKWVMGALIGVVVLGGAGGIVYWFVTSGEVYTDNALVSAPTTDIAPTMAGPLEQIYVNVGDEVGPDTVVARVGDEILKTKTASQIVTVDAAIGTLWPRGAIGRRSGRSQPAPRSGSCR